MQFQTQVLGSRMYDSRSVSNDEVYRLAQRKMMMNMLSKHDQSVLSEPGIEVSFAIRRLHEDLYPHIFDYNFSFEQQNDFYYQWYSEAIEKTSFERKHEFKDFYRVKAMHETMWSRQKEAARGKARLFSGYYSR
jgi:hypothetical protein